MQSGYYNTTGGMVTQFNRLDLISNNLANLNTTGFKRDDVVIGDYLRLYETHKEQLPIE
ncbi:MAG: flagellar basal body protein, partial [Helicobacter japonicus]|nr:flagellar basal body protein [Helicobacter japonicus]